MRVQTPRGVLAVIAAAGLLAACATATPYQPRSADGYGFTEQQIEENRVTLAFRGNSLTEREAVENSVLYRAAELTVQKGFDYFVITSRATEGKSELASFGPSRSPYFRYAYYSPRFGWGPWYDPFWDDPVRFREITRYEASAEIVMYKGQKPADRADAFDARQVEANLRAKIVRPTAG